MKSSPVTIQLSIQQEFDLMSKFGRKCSREGLVTRAIDFAIKSKGTEIKTTRTRKKKEGKANGLDEGKLGEQHDLQTQ